MIRSLREWRFVRIFGYDTVSENSFLSKWQLVDLSSVFCREFEQKKSISDPIQNICLPLLRTTLIYNLTSLQTLVLDWPETVPHYGPESD